MRRILTILLFASYSLQAANVGFSETQWKDVLNTNLDASLTGIYMFLGKNISDAALLLEYQLERDTTLLKMIAIKMQALRASLEASDGETLPSLLREVRLTHQAARSVAAHAEMLGGYYSRIRSAFQNACSEQTISLISKDFSTTGVLQVKSIIKNLQSQMTEVIKKDVTSFQVTINASGGQGTYGSFQSNGTSSNVQRAIVALFWVVGLIAGAAFFANPEVGAAVGSLVGSLVATILCGLFFSDPTVEMVKLLRAQSDYVVSATETLGRTGIKGSMKKFCGLYLEEDILKETFGEVEKNWPYLIMESSKYMAEITQIDEAIQSDFDQELDRLKNDVYPTVKLVIDEKFEACFAEIKRRSDDSRAFAEAKLPEPLKALFDPKTGGAERLSREENLWAALVEGEIKYSSLRGFGFQRSSEEGEAKELLAWDGIAKAVYRSLDKKLPRLAP